MHNFWIIIFLVFFSFGISFASSEEEDVYPTFCHYIQKCSNLYASIARADFEQRAKGNLSKQESKDLTESLGVNTARFQTACNMDVLELLSSLSSAESKKIKEQCGQRFLSSLRKTLEDIPILVEAEEKKK